MNRIYILIAALFVFIGCGGDEGKNQTSSGAAGQTSNVAGQPVTAGQPQGSNAGQPVSVAGQPSAGQPVNVAGQVSNAGQANVAGQPVNIAGGVNTCFSQGTSCSNTSECCNGLRCNSGKCDIIPVASCTSIPLASSTASEKVNAAFCFGNGSCSYDRVSDAAFCTSESGISYDVIYSTTSTGLTVGSIYVNSLIKAFVYQDSNGSFRYDDAVTYKEIGYCFITGDVAKKCSW